MNVLICLLEELFKKMNNKEIEEMHIRRQRSELSISTKKSQEKKK